MELNASCGGNRMQRRNTEGGLAIGRQNVDKTCVLRVDLFSLLENHTLSRGGNSQKQTLDMPHRC